jgi:hypothetical protein
LVFKIIVKVRKWIKNLEKVAIEYFCVYIYIIKRNKTQVDLTRIAKSNYSFMKYSLPHFLKYTFSLLLLFNVIGATAQTPANSSELNKDAGYALIKRILPKYADRFTIEYIAKENDKDVFELDVKGDKIILRGNNGVSVASALNYWLKNYAHCDISWNGTNLAVPQPFPMVKAKVHKVTRTNIATTLTTARLTTLHHGGHGIAGSGRLILWPLTA